MLDVLFLLPGRGRSSLDFKAPLNHCGVAMMMAWVFHFIVVIKQRSYQLKVRSSVRERIDDPNRDPNWTPLMVA